MTKPENPTQMRNTQNIRERNETKHVWFTGQNIEEIQYLKK